MKRESQVSFKLFGEERKEQSPEFNRDLKVQSRTMAKRTTGSKTGETGTKQKKTREI